MEHVERESCHEGVAHGILLVEVAADGAWFLIPPGAPFIDEQTDVLLGVFGVHDGAVLLDDVFDLEAFAERPVVLVVIEFRG